MLKAKDLNEVVRVGIELTTEKNRNFLWENRLRRAMSISGCDAGTLYLYQDDALVFRIMKTLSQGVSRGENGEKIDLPPVALREENVCAYSAIHRELINIPDVYCSERFDFSGPKRYDSITGYRTGSMLVIPLEGAESELIGVMQLMNKLDKGGQFIPFTQDDEFLLLALGSMAAVSVSNMIYIDELKAQMHSFVQAFAAAVDERTPYNGSHTRKVTVYVGLLADEINRRHDAGETEEYFDENRREQLLLAATLHDIGKMIVPLTVMNKATRLGDMLENVRLRFRLLDALYRCDGLTGRIPESEAEALRTELREGLEAIEAADTAGFLPDETIARFDALAAHCYVYEDGTELPWLTESESVCLHIRKGTLTAEERRIMESHAEMTRRILAKVRFRSSYSDVVRIAAGHHEYLNGSGYPDHLAAEALDTDVRILTVSDVFDALTSSDRPYKAPIPRPKAFAILREMVSDGQLDGWIVDCLESAVAAVPQEEIERLAEAGGS
jgi:HD-GYP domain-containing protein (c-di-GMP phosphodiesterase class II)